MLPVMTNRQLRELGYPAFAFNQAIEATRKAELAQQDINKTVKILETAVSKMKEFNSKVNSELSRIDGVNWKENALKHQNELDEIDKKANEIIETINNYKSHHNELMIQLINYKKEKLQTQKMLKFCWISTTCLFVVVLLLIIQIVFNVIKQFLNINIFRHVKKLICFFWTIY